MGDMSKTELGRRIIKGLEQLANDPTAKPSKRKAAAAKLAAWKAAREA